MDAVGIRGGQTEFQGKLALESGGEGDDGHARPDVRELLYVVIGASKRVRPCRSYPYGSELFDVRATRLGRDSFFKC